MNGEPAPDYKKKLLEGTPGESNKGTLTRATNSPILLAKLLKNIDKSYGNGEKNIDSSQIVDENGEPMVVYHGTNLDYVNQGEKFWTFYPDSSHKGTVPL